MSIELKLKSILTKHVQNLNRNKRRIFNTYLKRYPYIMFHPSIEHDDSTGEENPYFLVGFTSCDISLQKNELINAHSIIESDNKDNNIFYIDSAYSLVLDETVYIDSKEFDEIYISKAPIELAINADVLEKADTYAFMCALTEYFNIETLSYDDGGEISEKILEIPELVLDVIYKDIKQGTMSFGKSTQRVTFNNEVLGFLDASGFELSTIHPYVLNESKWIEMLNFVADKTRLSEYIEKSYSVLDPNKDCDLYLAIPGVTGKMNSEIQTKDLL